MIINKYGISLRLLEHRDIDLVRRMRNRPDIRDSHHFQGIITSDMQEEWFRIISDHKNFYFVIIFKGTRVGLIHGKNIDFDRRECEGGIFLWEDPGVRASVAARASICLAEVTFFIFNLDKVFARVRKDNNNAINYNKQLGYEMVFGLDSEWMVLTKAGFLHKAGPLRKKLASLTGDNIPLSVEDIFFDPERGDLERFNGLPADVRRNLASRMPGLGHSSTRDY